MPSTSREKPLGQRLFWREWAPAAPRWGRPRTFDRLLDGVQETLLDALVQELLHRFRTAEVAVQLDDLLPS